MAGGFSSQGPVSPFLNPGDYVRIETAEGDVHIGQVLHSEVREFDGPEVRNQDQSHESLSQAGLTFQGASVRLKMISLHGSGILLGVSDAAGNRRFTDANNKPASPAEVDGVLEAWASSIPTLTVGTLRAMESIPAMVNARGFNRHTFMCGQSGSG